MVPHYPLLQSPPLPYGAALSIPAMSTLAISCWFVHSCNVHPCHIVTICPLLHFLYPHFWPCRFVHSRKFHQPVWKMFCEDTPTSPDVIVANTLNFTPNFKFSRLIFLKPNFKFSRSEVFLGTPIPIWVCPIKTWSISSACKTMRGQHPLRAEM